jgi:molecular chaperone Hsp33
MTAIPVVTTDLVQPFQIEGLGVRGRLVRLGPALETMLAPHDYPPAVAGLLGEALAFAAVLAAGLKYEGIFSLQTRSDGPVSMMVTDITSEGGMRGYARFDAAAIAKAAEADGGLVPRLLGNGHLAFTVDQGPDTERYQGITSLEGATLTECAHNYFRQSEQLASAVVLAGSESGLGARAGGLMVQRLPRPGDLEPEHDEAWRRAVILMSTIKVDELLDGDLAPNDVLFRLYHEDGVRVFEPRPVFHTCRCSRERVARTLASFPRDDIADMKIGGKVVATCEFCKSVYDFDDDDLDALTPA